MTIPGGNFTGNSLVWRKVSFPAVTTTKIRVTVAATADGVARLMEVEAWGYETVNLNWLVTDQLGTPRMVFDKTGSLAATKRHDYLPFGEELFAGTGGRTTAQGYSATDGVRQKFTQKERDNETGLDYFGARYLASMQGRFTSTDPIALTAQRLNDPQQINLYSYARNNPLKYVDPDGEDTVTSKTEEYDFTIEKRGKDKKGREWVYQVKVSVTETTVIRRDDNGNITQRSTTATATAENTDQATNRLSQGQLDTVGRVTGIIVEEAANRGIARDAALAIGTRETFLGSESRNVSFQFQRPDLNPLQITTDSGKQPTTDLRTNIRSEERRVGKECRL